VREIAQNCACDAKNHLRLGLRTGHCWESLRRYPKPPRLRRVKPPPRPLPLNAFGVSTPSASRLVVFGDSSSVYPKNNFLDPPWHAPILELGHRTVPPHCNSRSLFKRRGRRRKSLYPNFWMKFSPLQQALTLQGDADQTGTCTYGAQAHSTLGRTNSHRPRI